MKKVSTHLFLLAAMLLSGAAAAQVFYTQDFAGGMPAGWTTTDGSNQGVLWKYCAKDTADQCANLFGTDEPAMATYANGSMIMNSDEHPGIDANGNPTTLPTNHKSRLTTSAIDCSGKAKVYLNFEMYYLVFATASKARLRVSNDGTNWTDFTIPYTTSTFPLSDGNTGNITENPYKPIINISSVAANKPTVYIEWEFDGNWDYWFWLDDVKLLDTDPTPSNNMKISSFFYPLTQYETPDFAIALDTFGFSCNVTNAGTDQTKLIVKAMVYNEAAPATLIWQDSLITQGLAGGVDSAFAFTNRFAPELPAGKYSIRYNAYIPGVTDATPADNNAKQGFSVNNQGKFARDAGGTLTFTRPATIPAEGWAAVHYYHMLGGVNDDFHIKDVEWRCGQSGGMDNEIVNIYILEIDDAVVDPAWNGFDPDGLPLDSKGTFQWIGNLSYEYQDTTSGNFPLIKYPIFDFPDGNPGVNISQGKRYLMAVSFEGDSKDVSMGFVTNVPYSNINTFIYAAPTWYGGFSGGEYTGFAHMYVYVGKAGVAANEPQLPDGVLTVFPNPTSDRVNLELDFDQPTSVTVTLAANDGRVISVQDYENQTHEVLSYDITDYPAGTYMARIATPDGIKVKMFNVIR